MTSGGSSELRLSSARLLEEGSHEEMGRVISFLLTRQDRSLAPFLTLSSEDCFLEKTLLEAFKEEALSEF